MTGVVPLLPRPAFIENALKSEMLAKEMKKAGNFVIFFCREVSVHDIHFYVNILTTL
jgi:hypothetical protein